MEWISPESSERHLFIEENFVKSSGAVGLIQISILHHSFWQWLIYSIKIKMRDSEIEKCISSLSYLPQVSQMFIWQLWRVQLDSITKLSTAPNPGWPTKRKSLMTTGPETTLSVYKQMLIIWFMSAGNPWTSPDNTRFKRPPHPTTVSVICVCIGLAKRNHGLLWQAMLLQP